MINYEKSLILATSIVLEKTWKNMNKNTKKISIKAK